MTDVLQVLFWIGVSLTLGVWTVWAYWRLRSEWMRRMKGEAPLESSRAAIWRDPGPIAELDLEAGPCGRGGAPAPPFHFLEEHDTGSQPCCSVRDRRGRVWRVKWGPEVHTEVIGTRLAWALGYFAEQCYFVARGRIAGAKDLRRAKACIDDREEFTDARFELDEAGVVKHFDEHGWSWDDNPFVGSRELNGLRILMMLLSNWDNKDVRDVARGSNNAIFEVKSGRHDREARYLIIDWGAAMGAWGSNVLQRGRWDPEAFAAQNEQFVLGLEGDKVLWGYQGQRTMDMVQNITREDVRWFYRLAGQLTDDQLRGALRASGANPEEVEAFTAALRQRIEKLRSVAS
jgi:hypothetical protein